MATKKKETPTSDTLDTLQLKNEALAEEVVSLGAELDTERAARQALQKTVTELQAAVSLVNSSVSIAPPPPPPPVRPVVEIGGERWRFKVGSFRLKNREVLAEDVAQDEARLDDLFKKYPGLFERAD